MFALVAIVLVGCGSPSTPPDRSVEAPGSHAVGTTRYTLTDGALLRTYQVWYPSTSPATTVAIEQLEDEPARGAYAALLGAAGTCPTRQVEVALDGAPTPGPFPLVLFSHCHLCTRLSNITTAIRLASHGFVVIAVDHIGATLWDLQAGVYTGLTREALAQRVADLAITLDPGQRAQLPAGALAADLSRFGVFGHSFGAVTAGRLAQLDDRVVAAAALAAPMENPLIPGVTLAEIDDPLLFLIAQEDNSITELGNGFIRDNYAEAIGPAWKLEVTDAGHWSVSDLVDIVDGFAAGCGDGTRQDDGEPFTYLDPIVGRGLTAAYVTALFRATLDDDPGARAYLAREFPDALVSVEHHE